MRRTAIGWAVRGSAWGMPVTELRWKLSSQVPRRGQGQAGPGGKSDHSHRPLRRHQFRHAVSNRQSCAQGHLQPPHTAVRQFRLSKEERDHATTAAVKRCDLSSPTNLEACGFCVAQQDDRSVQAARQPGRFRWEAKKSSWEVKSFERLVGNRPYRKEKPNVYFKRPKAPGALRNLANKLKPI
jgi:hypothetical protein